MQCLTDFYPIILKAVKDFIFDYFVSNINTGNLDSATRYRVIDPEIQFSPKNLKSLIDNFIMFPDMRFDAMKIDVEHVRTKQRYVGAEAPSFNFVYEEYKPLTPEEKKSLQRPFTYTDLMFIAAFDSTTNKHAVLTRYPILSYLNTIMQKVVVGSTIKTLPIIFHHKVYEHYPYVEYKLPTHEVPTRYVETVVMSNSLLSEMGADYDGDQLTVKGLWSVEANAEANSIINAKSQYIGLDLGNVKPCDNEVIQTIYMMTLNPKTS
jgi:hypothetical protein